MERREVLTIKERAYILDKIMNTSFFFEEFGLLDPKEEEAIIKSVFKKLEFTYYLQTGYKYFKLNHFDFTEQEA